jgi:pyruvate dehydrogenase E1 component beta subunit
LLKAAIRTDDPVVFLENEIMYNEEFTVPEEVTGMDFLLPIGKARVMKEGKDVTIVSYALGVKHSLEAA